MTADAGAPGARAATRPRAAAEMAAPGLRTDEALHVAGVIGRELAEPLGDMQAIVQDFMRTGRISRAQVQQLNAAIDRARTVAVHSQQLDHMTRGDLQLAPERLRLDVALARALAERMPALQRLGVTVEQDLVQAHVVLDAGLLSSLVEAAIECAALRGHHLVVSLRRPAHVPQAVLDLRATLREAPAVPPTGDDADRLCWYLLREMSALAQAQVHHSLVAGALQLSIVFALQPRSPATPAFDDSEGSENSWLHSESLGVNGHRVLLISGQASLRAQTAQICETMGLSFIWAPSSAIAESEVVTARPDLVLADERAEDVRVQRLHQDLKQADPGFPWLRIAKPSHGLALEYWTNEPTDRLTPQNLRTQLPRMLLLHLSRRPQA